MKKRRFYRKVLSTRGSEWKKYVRASRSEQLPRDLHVIGRVGRRLRCRCRPRRQSRRDHHCGNRNSRPHSAAAPRSSARRRRSNHRRRACSPRTHPTRCFGDFGRTSCTRVEAGASARGKYRQTCAKRHFPFSHSRKPTRGNQHACSPSSESDPAKNKNAAPPRH